VKKTLLKYRYTHLTWYLAPKASTVNPATNASKGYSQLWMNVLSADTIFLSKNQDGSTSSADFVQSIFRILGCSGTANLKTSGVTRTMLTLTKGDFVCRGDSLRVDNATICGIRSTAK
jgi:hypothetical protein